MLPSIVVLLYPFVAKGLVPLTASLVVLVDAGSGSTTSGSLSLIFIGADCCICFYWVSLRLLSLS